MEDLDRDILESLQEVGIQFWVLNGELRFKYPEGLEGDRKSLYKFIKNHQAGLIRILQR